MRDFNNKIVVITGAASGMGRAYALAFARQGSQLALCDVDEAGLQETAAQVAAEASVKVFCSVVNVADEAAVFGFADAVRTELGNAHCIINNAGIEGGLEPAWNLDARTVARVMAVNFDGVVYGTRAFLPQLEANGEGCVVNISSIFGLVGTPRNADYCASKFAVRGFTEALMIDLWESPVTAHLVHPGGIATNIVRNRNFQTLSEEFLTTPPGEIAEVVITALKKGKPRIVYGNMAFRTWLVSKLLSLGLQNRLIWRLMSRMPGVVDTPPGAGKTSTNH